MRFAARDCNFLPVSSFISIYFCLLFSSFEVSSHLIVFDVFEFVDDDSRSGRH